jgi:Pyruvate/2-oxoacid:ferredoxin oxidoreductase delta subunit/NAD(P)H-dependent FMN reductase
MKIELNYFTGTGNSWKILETCKEVFIENHHSVSISPIGSESQTAQGADLLGFCFPVYAFGIPRICRRYLKQLPKFSNTQHAFVIITAGKGDEAGFSVNQCEKLLRKRNCSVIYSAVVEMPINWTTYMNPPSGQEALRIIEAGLKQAREIGNDIEKGIRKYHIFNIPENYGRFGLYKEYYLFKYLGLKNMWRSFKVYSSCNGCETCSKICPTASIIVVNKKPRWSSSCEQCMRCVNYCPRQAIYQSIGGGTSGRNRYHFPGFKPLAT